MINNEDKLKKFERDLIRNRKVNFSKNLKIINELHRYAKNLGVFGKNPLAGIEVDLHIAKIINHVRESS